MARPARFEAYRYLGDKRNQVVYDLDIESAAVITAVQDVLDAEAFTTFGPDTLAEAQNRGYRTHRSIRIRRSDED